MATFSGVTSVVANANATSISVTGTGINRMHPMNQCAIKRNPRNDLFLNIANGRSYRIDPAVMTSPSGTVATIQTALEALIIVPT